MYTELYTCSKRNTVHLFIHYVLHPALQSKRSYSTCMCMMFILSLRGQRSIHIIDVLLSWFHWMNASTTFSGSRSTCFVIFFEDIGHCCILDLLYDDDCNVCLRWVPLSLVFWCRRLFSHLMCDEQTCIISCLYDLLLPSTTYNLCINQLLPCCNSWHTLT